jgi:hypothetical protein
VPSEKSAASPSPPSSQAKVRGGGCWRLSSTVLRAAAGRARRHVVLDAAGHEACLGVGERPFAQVPDGGAAGRDGPLTPELPAGHGSRPSGSDGTTGQGRVPIGGAEVRGCTPLVNPHPGRDGQGGVGQRHLEAPVVDLRPGRGRSQQHRRGDEDGVVQPCHQLPDVELGALPVGHRDHVQQLASHPALSSQVGVASEHAGDAGPAEPHHEDAGDLGSRVVLPRVHGHPALVRAQAEAAAKMGPERPVPRPAHDAHDAEVALHDRGEAREVGLSHRRVGGRAGGEGGRRLRSQ